MTRGRVLRDSDRQVLVAKAWRADGMLERMRGLIGRSPLGAGEALLIRPCSSVHTLFMAYALDVVFLSRDGTVRKVVEHLTPWRAAACFGAAATLELLAGAARQSGIHHGQRLQLVWEDGR